MEKSTSLPKEEELRGKKARENARAVEDETPPLEQRLQALLLRDGDRDENDVVTVQRVRMESHLHEAGNERGNGRVQQVGRQLLGRGVVAVVITKELLAGGEGGGGVQVEEDGRKRLEKGQGNRLGNGLQLPEGDCVRETRSHEEPREGPQVGETTEPVA